MMKRRRIGQEGQAVKFDRKNGKTGNCELTPLDCDKHFPIKALWKFFLFCFVNCNGQSFYNSALCYQNGTPASFKSTKRQ